MKQLTYLASPYSHDDPEVRHRRFEIVCEYAARLISAGDPTFSPIVHGHPIFLKGCGTQGWDTWGKIDEAILRVSRRMLVLRLPGWELSHGIENEIRLANAFCLPISYVDYCEQCQLFISQFTLHDHGEIPADPFDAEELARLRQKMRQYGEGSQSPPARDLARLLELEAQERQLQETTR
jgi:hypothetical protein